MRVARAATAVLSGTILLASAWLSACGVRGNVVQHRDTNLFDSYFEVAVRTGDGEVHWMTINVKYAEVCAVGATWPDCEDELK